MSTLPNALVFQSGGVTAVINQSLAGVVLQAIESGRVGSVYGAMHGLDGLLAQDLRDLTRRSARFWTDAARSPGALLGSARRRLRPEDAGKALGVLKGLDVQYLFPIGGNDSAETAHLLAEAAQAARQTLHVVAVPKTVDNDLPGMDHCPGYGSAARFIALAAMGAGRDAESMGKASPVTVLEVMGRNAGWLAAAAALGKREERDPPHVVCFPELALDEDAFAARIEDALGRFGHALAVVSENQKGLSGPLGHSGEPLYVDDFGHPYYQSPGQYLAQQLSRRLKNRVRFEKPGTIQRSLVSCVSSTDAQEAHLAGRAAVRHALAGKTDVMVSLLRSPPLLGKEGVGAVAAYRCETGLVPLTSVAARERILPPEYMDPSALLPTAAFTAYAMPLIGSPRLPRFPRL